MRTIGHRRGQTEFWRLPRPSTATMVSTLESLPLTSPAPAAFKWAQGARAGFNANATDSGNRSYHNMQSELIVDSVKFMSNRWRFGVRSRQTMTSHRQRRRSAMATNRMHASGRRPAIGKACQYNFFGGSECRIRLRKRATAAAFLRLRLAVGFSYAVRARSSLTSPVLSIARRKRRRATSTGSLSLGITVVKSFLEMG